MDSHQEEIEWYKKELGWYKGKNNGLQEGINGVVGWYKGKLDRLGSDLENQRKVSREVIEEAQNDLVMQSNALIKLRATPGVAAALAAAEESHRPRVQVAGAATENAARNASGAYIHAAQDWPRIGHYQYFGDAGFALKAAADAAAAAAAFQRAAQAEAGGQRAYERFLRLEADPPRPDSNERIAKEWSAAVQVAKGALHEAEGRLAAARARHEDATQASEEVGAAWHARLAKEASERVDAWQASGHVADRGGLDSPRATSSGPEDSDSELPAPESPDLPVPGPPAAEDSDSEPLVRSGQKRAACKPCKGPAGKSHKKKRSD